MICFLTHANKNERERELKLIGVNFLASKEKINGTLSKLRINTL